MGGKTSSSTQQVQIPPQVLAEYSNVNNRANATANTPFQAYSTDPNKFVAPVNSTQTGGINQTVANANEAAPAFAAANSTLDQAQAATTPYYGAATQSLGAAQGVGNQYLGAAKGLAGAGTQAVDPTQLNSASINQYLSPYLQDVAQSQEALLNQQNQQQMSGELGNVIRSGAFGGDRAGIDMSVLARQQDLANNSILSNILNTGYNTALGTAQQQQGVGLAAGQANRAAVQQGAQEFAALDQQGFGQDITSANTAAGLAGDIYGTGAATSAAQANLGAGAQSAALQGGQAQLAAGQVQQATSQAGLSALYNQFLQQQSYPFQVDQFLANIAEGTGSLSGSTTTTTQPGGLFSDERLKEDIKEVGKLKDGQKVYSFRYKGEPTTHIGLLAQEVEKHHPEAVGLSGGFKTVEYGAATQDAARKKRASGGLAGANDNGYAFGGSPGYDPLLMQQILANSASMYGPYGSSLAGGSPASTGSGPYGGAARVPSANVPVNHLMTAGSLPSRPSLLDQADRIAKLGTQTTNAVNNPDYRKAFAAVRRFAGGLGGQGGPTAPDLLALSGASGGQGGTVPANDIDIADLMPQESDVGQWRQGGRVRRYANGGLAGYEDYADDPYQSPHGALDIPNDTPSAKLATAPGLGGGSGPNPLTQASQLASTIGTTAKAAESIAQAIPAIIAMFKDGGRVGRADGGAAPEPLDFGSLLKSLMTDQSDDADEPAAPTPPKQSVSTDPALQIAKTITTISPNAAPNAAATAPLAPGALPVNTPLSTTLALIAKAEGTGKNPRSSANGLYQITNPTFVGLYREMFPQQASDMSDGDIKSLRSTAQGPALNAQMGPFLVQKNAGILKQHGFDASPGNVYLAHFLGPHYALATLGADPDTPASSVLPESFISANPTVLKGKTASQVVQWAGNRLQRFSKAHGGALGYDDGGTVDDGGSTASAASPDIVDELLDNSDAGLAAAGPPPADSAPSGLAGAIDPMVADATSGDVAPAGLSPTPKKSGMDQLHDAWGELKKPDVFIPLLTGLAAAGSAPTKHFFTALEIGGGAAAQAYQGQRQFGLEQTKTAQEQQKIDIAKNLQQFRTGPEFQLGRQKVGAEVLAQQMQNFESQYGPSAGGEIDPVTKQPLSIWGRRENRAMTGAEYAAKRQAFMTNVLHPFGMEDLAPAFSSGALSVPTPQTPGAATTPVASAPVATPPVETASMPGGSTQHAPTADATHAAAPPGVRPGDVAYKVSTGAYKIDPTRGLPPIDASHLPPDYNPETLMQRAKNLRDQGQTGAADALQKTAQDVLSGAIQPTDPQTHQPYQGYIGRNAALERNKSLYANQTAAAAALTNETTGFAAGLGLQQQILDTADDARAHGDTNALSEKLASLVGTIRGLPGIPADIDAQLNTYQTTNDLVKKSAARNAILQAATNGLGHTAPATVLHQTNLTVPGPDMAPDAAFEISAQNRALMLQNAAKYAYYSAHKGDIDDISGFMLDWAKENPVAKFENQAYAEVPYYMNQSAASKALHPKDFVDANTGATLRGPDGKIANLPKNTVALTPRGNKMYWDPQTSRFRPRPVQ